MAKKPTYEELEQRVRELEQEAVKRTKAEEALAEERFKLAEYFENLPVLAYNVSFDGEIVDCNSLVVRALGFDSKDELVGKPLVPTVYAPSFQKKAKELFNKWKKEGKIKNEEMQIITKRGEILDVLLNVDIIHDRNGMPVHSLSTHLDITERKQAEERIKEQTEFLRLVLDSLPHPFYVVDAVDYTIKMANSAAHEGRLSKDVTCYALTHKGDTPCGSEEHPCPLEIVRETKQATTLEHIHYDRDGNLRYVEVHAYPIFDSDGNVCQMIESSLDISERKQAEEALQKAHEALEKRVEERTAELVTANEQLRQEIEERKRAQEALQYRVEFEKLVSAISTKFINLAPDEIDGGINYTLQRIGEFAGVDRSYVFQFYDDGTTMDNTHEWCAKGIETHAQRLKGIPVDAFPWATERLNRLETLHIPLVADLPPEARHEKEELQSGGIQSLINVPMVSGGSLVGMLGFDSVRGEKTWAVEDMTLLKTVGAIVVNALERKRAEGQIRHLSQQLIGAMEDERKKVARDLHDELGQALTAFHFGIEALQHSLPGELKDQKTRCDELVGMVEEIGDTVRNISSDLRPDMLDLLGLVPTLEWYIDDFVKRREEVQIDFQATGIKKRPDPEIEIVLYRIFQEGLNNIAKHAEAKHVSVLLAFSHPKLILTIKDDGVGFEQREGMPLFGAKQEGIGLLGMRERVASIGGTIEIRSSTGKGTVIRAEVPTALREDEV